MVRRLNKNFGLGTISFVFKVYVLGVECNYLALDEFQKGCFY